MIRRTSTILDRIVDEKIKEVERLKKDNKLIIDRLKEETINNRRLFEKELAKKELTVIAEIKKASPSKGVIAKKFEPDKQLKEYVKGGARVISVLTDKKFFQGSPEILKKLQAKTDLPILRKDFIIDPVQVYESFYLKANIILLIAAILEKKDLINLIEICNNLGIEALIEVHNNHDLEKVLETEARIIGINNRNLKNFNVDLKNTEKIITRLDKMGIRNQFYLVSESGIKSRADISYLQGIGVNGVLIGESLMRANNPAEKIHELIKNQKVI